MSNATNASVLSLKLSGKILAIVNVSPRSLIIKPNEKSTKIEKRLTLTTEKRDFTVKDITFEKSKKKTPMWQKDALFDIKHNITRSDSADSDGYYSFYVDISFDYTPKETLSGYFYLKTNHPKQETIQIRGIIKKLQEKRKVRK